MSHSRRTSRVLVLDDEQSIARLCVRVIAPLGARADEAGTIAQAAALIAENHYDLLVCDMRLPDGSGLDAERLFRERNPRGRVIVITGSLMPEHPAFAREGIVVLTKPFELADFRSAVAKFLSAVPDTGSAM